MIEIIIGVIIGAAIGLVFGTICAFVAISIFEAYDRRK